MPHPTCRPRAIGAGNPASASLYRARNLIERFFSKLKHFRRIATRYDKLAATFLAIVQLASMRLWLRAYESMTLVICPALCHFRTHTVQRPRPTIRKRGPDGEAATCFRVPYCTSVFANPRTAPSRPRSFSVLLRIGLQSGSYDLIIAGTTRGGTPSPDRTTLFRLHLREPEAHAHPAVHIFCSGKMLAGGLRIARAVMKPTQTKMTMSDDRPHPA